MHVDARMGLVRMRLEIRRVPVLKRFITVSLVAMAALFFAALPAFAYDELSTGKACNDCHGLEEGATAPAVTAGKGPHGGYTTGTQKCQTCHTIHDAPFGSVILLPAATIKDTCNSCHDGTGGQGVYGAIAARGLTVGSAHDIEQTNVIPGGAADGGARTQIFSADGGLLTCSDCHSPHDSNTVTGFVGDRMRSSEPATDTNRLLRNQPTGSSVVVAEYGSNWCGTCHIGRLSGSAGVYNHPVETQTAGFDYDNIVRVTSANTTATEMGSLGGSNYGYVMPLPRSALQAGKYPICHQCHEDARSIGDDPAQPQTVSTLNGYNEVFAVTGADGTVATDSPRFQTFPHESTGLRLLVEQDDDLCTNCHVPPSGG